jgi:hypothetical protein
VRVAGIADEHAEYGEISGIRAENCVANGQQRFGPAVECDGQALPLQATGCTADSSTTVVLRLAP